jgi:hypothetical protein
VILKIVQKHIEERGLLNASQFSFHAHHSMTLQCMRLMDHMTLNFNNNMSMTAMFSDIKKAFDTTWHSGLLYKLAKLEFSTNLIKLISSFLSQCSVSVLVQGEMSVSEMKGRVPQSSVLSPTLYNMYVNDASQTTSDYVALFANDTCM